MQLISIEETNTERVLRIKVDNEEDERKIIQAIYGLSEMIKDAVQLQRKQAQNVLMDDPKVAARKSERKTKVVHTIGKPVPYCRCAHCKSAKKMKWRKA